MNKKVRNYVIIPLAVIGFFIVLGFLEGYQQLLYEARADVWISEQYRKYCPSCAWLVDNNMVEEQGDRICVGISEGSEYQQCLDKAAQCSI
jgi:hypothetical protein